MIRLSAALLLLVLATPVTAAEPFTVGARLEPLVMADQHGAEIRVGEDTRILLFARDMAGGDLVEEALGDDGAAVLGAASAVFVSDISRMPGIITRIFALPAMRRRPYRMALDFEGDATASFPHREDHVTVVRLSTMKVDGIEFVASAAEVRTKLVAAAPTGK
jgi:hypothetical protein